MSGNTTRANADMARQRSMVAGYLRHPSPLPSNSATFASASVKPMRTGSEPRRLARQKAAASPLSSARNVKYSHTGELRHSPSMVCAERVGRPLITWIPDSEAIGPMPNSAPCARMAHTASGLPRNTSGTKPECASVSATDWLCAKSCGAYTVIALFMLTPCWPPIGHTADPTQVDDGAQHEKRTTYRLHVATGAARVCAGGAP